MMTLSATSGKLMCLFALCIIALGLGSRAAYATSGSIAVSGAPSGAVLDFTFTFSTVECIFENERWIDGTDYTFTSFDFVSGGVSYPLSGTQRVIAIPNGESCKEESIPVSLALPSTYDPGYACSISFNGYPESASLSCIQEIKGYIDLRYLILGVTYAPPGPSTNTFVQYMNSTLVGNTVSLSSSFLSSYTKSVSVSTGFTIPAVLSGSIKNTTATTMSQTSTNSSTVTTSFQVQNGEKTFGGGTYMAPVDNDYDYVWVWLNPVEIFTITGSTITWNGYGYNSADENQPDIVGIELGYLNGHFGAIPPDIQNSLNRTWAANEVFYNGETAALNSTDLAAIEAADPFSVSSYGPGEIGYDPPSGTTADGLFTPTSCTSQSAIGYVQGPPVASPPETTNLTQIATCTLTYTDLTSQTSSIQTVNSQTFSVDEQISASFLDPFTASLEKSYSITQTDTAQQSITSSTTQSQSAALSLQGPPCDNVLSEEGPCVPVYDSAGNEPTQFDVFQDNRYGTFMFAPVHYYNQ